jgi:hydroxypyruvate reductase
VPRTAGKGGRSTHLATLVAPSLRADEAFLAAATDGVDGMGDTGGALVDGSFARRADPAAVARAIGRFDTGTLHRELGTALARHPTGHNLADLHVLVRR